MYIHAHMHIHVHICTYLHTLAHEHTRTVGLRRGMIQLTEQGGSDVVATSEQVGPGAMT